MDYLSRLLGRIFGRFVGRKEDEELEVSAQELATAQRRNAQSLDELNERLTRMERHGAGPDRGTAQRDGAAGTQAGSNVLRLPPMAAE
jgi:hypothetical protein